MTNDQLPITNSPPKARGEVLWEQIRAARPVEAMRARWAGLGRRGRGLLAAAVLCLVGFWIWQFGFSPARDDETWRRIHASGVITFVADASFPPFEALDANGDFFGFDVDVARELGRRLGVRADFENVAYDGLLGALIVGRDDAAISALVARPERLNEVLFTRPYFNAGTLLVVRAREELPPDVDPLAWAEGQRLGVEYGSQADALARDWARRKPGVAVTAYPDAGAALQAVEDGALDAALADAVMAYDFLRGHPGLAVGAPPLDDALYVMAVARRSVTLHRALNSALEAMEADGALGELRARWFGEAARAMTNEQ